MKRGSACALMVAVTLGACGGSDGSPPAGGASPDGNDTFATAQAVAVGSSTAGVISSATDDDWYQFTVAGAGTVTVSLTGLSADVDLALHDSAQASLGASSNPGIAGDTVTWTAPAAATIYVHAVPVVAGATYSLGVTFTPQAGDGNDTFATAQGVAIGTMTQGVISSATDDDWYTFTTAGAGTIRVTLGALSADANLALHETEPSPVATSANAGTASDVVSWTAAAGGRFYAHVVPQAVGASYTLTVAFTPSGGDGNDTFATAQLVAVPSATVGVVSSSVDPDWYLAHTPGAGRITVTLSGLTSDADLELYGELPNLFVAFSYLAGTQTDTVSFTATSAVNYHVLVKPVGAATSYTLTVAFTP